jgi:hypothetical protein
VVTLGKTTASITIIGLKTQEKSTERKKIKQIVWRSDIEKSKELRLDTEKAQSLR